SVEASSSHISGVTLQESGSFRQVFSLVVMPTMSMGGRNRETIRAVPPEREQATMALAWISMAMPQVAWEMASVMLWIWKVVEWKRCWKSMACSVRSAILAMVATASTGYLPMALSPESMMALVPS